MKVMWEDKKVKEAYENACDVISQNAIGQFDYDCSTAPAMTHIEQIMFFELMKNNNSDIRLGFKIEPQKQIGKFRVDFLVSHFDEQFVVECDGHDFHEKTKEQAQKDKQRDRILQKLGFKVFRFTGSEIWSRSEWKNDIDDEREAIMKRHYNKYNAGIKK